jgi:hypothetical protein
MQVSCPNANCAYFVIAIWQTSVFHNFSLTCQENIIILIVVFSLKKKRPASF